MTTFSTRPEPDPVGRGQESAWEYPRPPRLKPTSGGLAGPVARWFRGARGTRGGLLLPGARDPPVGEALAAGLGRRAVDDLVRLVRDTAQAVPATRAWRAGATVPLEVPTELRLGER